jgi:hypothetical protein
VSPALKSEDAKWEVITGAPAWAIPPHMKLARITTERAIYLLFIVVNLRPSPIKSMDFSPYNNFDAPVPEKDSRWPSRGRIDQLDLEKA